MEYEKIELAARELQKEIYRGRDALWVGVDIPPFCKMFSAEVAAKVLGIDYEIHPQLGRFGNGLHRFEVAGLIDRQGNRIAVARNLDGTIERFTGAHEIGHWQLHKNEMVMHRDRPVAGLSSIRNARSLEEKQADYFAACFLAPRNVVVAEFEERFGPISAFRFDDSAAFGLRRRNPGSLTVSSEDSFEWELALASASIFPWCFF